MKLKIMSLLDTFGSFELLLLCTVLPAAFIYLWTLIFGDFKNFVGSRKSLTIYKATDMVNCYQNYTHNKKEDEATAQKTCEKQN